MVERHVRVPARGQLGDQAGIQRDRGGETAREQQRRARAGARARRVSAPPRAAVPSAAERQPDPAGGHHRSPAARRPRDRLHVPLARDTGRRRPHRRRPRVRTSDDHQSCRAPKPTAVMALSPDRGIRRPNCPHCRRWHQPSVRPSLPTIPLSVKAALTRSVVSAMPLPQTNLSSGRNATRAEVSLLL
jgi:hypothetical protein